MKAWQLATNPSFGEGLLHARWFNVVVVEFELAYSIWLLLGVCPRFTRWATIGLFSVFAGVSLYKGISGEASCGCFGAARVNPWLTTALDVAIVGSLLWRRKVRIARQKITIRKIALAALAWGIISAPILSAIVTVEKNDLSALGTEFIGADGRKTVLLEPEKWTDDKFPLAPYLEPPEVREQLKTGEWTILLYRRDCSKCHKAIADLASKGTPNVLCVEVPPYGDDEDDEIPSAFIKAKLTNSINWFVETPKTFVINN